MTKDNATPRPWRLGREDMTSYDGETGIHIKRIYTPTDDDIQCNGDDCEANARLIVKAVNCHDDFISLAQSVMKLDCPEHIHVMAYKLLKKASE